VFCACNVLIRDFVKQSKIRGGSSLHYSPGYVFFFCLLSDFLDCMGWVVKCVKFYPSQSVKIGPTTRIMWLKNYSNMINVLIENGSEKINVLVDFF
jgi:hypothetical protein